MRRREAATSASDDRPAARLVLASESGRRHREGAPLPLARARGLDGSAVQLDDVARDGEPETEALLLSRAGGVRLPEALEDEGQELRA